jgi:hypothetical protein
VILRLMRGSRLLAALVTAGMLWSVVPGLAQLGPLPSRTRSESLQRAAAEPRSLNVRQFGASGDDRVVTAHTSAGSRVLMVSASAGFAAGQFVALAHVGPSTLLPPPAGVAAVAMTYNQAYIVNKPVCVADRGNPACSTIWTFRVVAVDRAGGMSAPSMPVQVFGGPARPNPTNRIKLWWNSQTEATGYLVYGCSGGDCTPSLVAVLPNNWYHDTNESPCSGCKRPVVMVFWYMGRAFGIVEGLGNRMPAAALNQTLYTRIVATGGHSITLEKAPSATATTQMGWCMMTRPPCRRR